MQGVKLEVKVTYLFAYLALLYNQFCNGALTEDDGFVSIDKYPVTQYKFE